MRRNTDSPKTTKGWQLLRLLVGALLVAAISYRGGAASAHDGDFDGNVYPENESVLPGTPRDITVLDANPAKVVIELKRADGTRIAFTGEAVIDDDSLSVTPPVLEPGTYVLTWNGSDGENVSVFSVGRVDAEVTTRTGGTVWAGLAGALLAGAWAAGILLRRRDLTAERASLALLSLLPGVGAGFLLYGAGSPSAIAAIVLTTFGAVGLTITTGAHSLSAHGAPARLIAVATGWILTLLLPAAALLTGAGMLSGILLGGAILVNLVAGAGSLARTAGRKPVRAFGAIGVIALTAVGVMVGEKIDVAMLEKSAEAAEDCMNGGNRLEIQRCLEGSLVYVAETEGVDASLQTLEGLTRSNGRARYFCHEASHAIGRASLRINETLTEAFRDGYDVCDFGYYHGIVEGASAGMDDATFEDAVSTLCSKFASAEELFFMQCNHGIGHAAARRTNNDMLRGLAFCDAISGTDGLEGERLRTARNGCGTGVTMEWFATATLTEDPTVTPKVEEPRDVCHQVPQQWAAECYEYVGNTLNASDPVNSLIELSAWCNTSTQAGPCFKGLARAAAGVGLSDRDAVAVCDGARDIEARDGCVSYYIATVATTIDYDEKAVGRICAILPPADRDGQLCKNALEAVRQVLAGGDGKTRP